ncbi:MAG: O-antigen ligase family protein [Candidatus Omnitrophota bacterium]
MNPLFLKLKNIAAFEWAIFFLMALWTALTFSIALTEITFVCALICWVGWHIQQKKGICQNAPAGGKIDWAFWMPLALFFVCVLSSFFTSEYPKQSLRGLYKIAKPLLAFIMAIDLFRDTRSQKRFDGIFLATFLLVTIDCSIQYAFGKDILRGFAAEQSAAGIRLIGPFGNFAKMATYLVLVIPVFGMRFWSDYTRSEQRKRSFYSLALAIAGLVLLYLTRCRGPVVALAFSFGILFIYKRWFKVVGIALLLGLALLAVVPRGVIIHANKDSREQSFVERLCLWQRAFDVIKAKPLTGTGINTYDKAHAKYDTQQRKNLASLRGPTTSVRQEQNGSVSFITGETIYTSDVKQTNIRLGDKKYNLFRDAKGEYYIYDTLLVRGYYAHNGYLQLAAEIGLPGIFCFLWFLFMFFRKVLGGLGAIRGSPEEYTRLGILTGLLAFLIYAIGDNNLQSPPSLMFFWFSAGILMARQSAAPSEIISSKKP